MNPEVKILWLEALRSGRYLQGKGALRKGDAYCCLGILCDLHAQAHGFRWDPYGIDTNGSRHHRYFLHSGGLPPEVQAWAGVEGDGAYHADPPYSLAVENDAGLTFTEIAQKIEQYL